MPLAEAGPAERVDGASAERAGRRVVVSGAGAVSGFGWGVEALWRGLRAGATAIRPFTRFDHAGHRTHLAAEVPSAPPAPAARRPPGPPGPPRPRRAGPAADRQLSMADRFALAAAPARPGSPPAPRRRAGCDDRQRRSG